MKRHRFQRVVICPDGTYRVEYLRWFKWHPYTIKDNYYGEMSLTFHTCVEAEAYAEDRMKGTLSAVWTIYEHER